MLGSLDGPRPVNALALACACAVTLTACERGEAGRPAQTTTTSLTIPRPESTGITKHTIDNAGFVDNAGNTSEMTGRSEMSGMRATETGSERPTGTPGSGTPIPIPGSEPPHSVGEVLLEGERTTTTSSNPQHSGGLSFEASYRIARARCDREAACNRIGTGRPWGTQDTCVAEQHERVRVDFASLSCARGMDSVQLGACLNAMRNRPCDDAGPELDSVSECRSSALCTP